MTKRPKSSSNPLSPYSISSGDLRMKYVGLQTQIDRNNRLSVLLLLLFPSIILGMVWVFLALADYFGTDYRDEYGEPVRQLDVATVNYYFMTSIP